MLAHGMKMKGGKRMKYFIYPAAILTVCLSFSLAAAQTKVVVVPLGGTKTDANLLPKNIVYGVTIFGVTGTQVPASMTVASAGQIWMDRNLGASRVATSMEDAVAYGDLYQWGRLADGHQSRTSPTTSTLSTNDVPGHGSFILAPSSPYDWRSPQNVNLWQGTYGVNNPCPAGFRLPTETELDTERLSWSSQDPNGAFASPLKLVPAGYRDGGNGSIYLAGSNGAYWSGTVIDINSRSLGFYSGYAAMDINSRVGGYSVRCLRD